jgi:hypothetical protein
VTLIEGHLIPDTATFEEGCQVAAIVEAIEQLAPDENECPVKFRCE